MLVMRTSKRREKRHGIESSSFHLSNTLTCFNKNEVFSLSVCQITLNNMRLPVIRFILKRKFQERFVLTLMILTLGGIAIFFSFNFPSDFSDGTEYKIDAAIITANERFVKFNKALSIFFIETSGRTCLSARQACGIESAARANPKAIITLYMEKNPIVDLKKIDGSRKKVDCDITSALLRDFENVRVIREDLLGYLEGTPFWEFYRTGSFNKSTTPLVHRSDVIRVALLWKNGGVYLDLDCIVMRPLDSLNNTVGTVQDFIPNWVENGVMAFTAGHPFLYFLMKLMILAFRWDNYLSLGPPALTEAILEFCNRNDLPPNKWLHCWRNSSIFIQPADSFYAIGSGRADAFYQPEVDPADWDKLKKSFLSHIYDSGSGRTVPSSSLYTHLARKYCSVSYRMVTEESGQS